MERDTTRNDALDTRSSDEKPRTFDDHQRALADRIRSAELNAQQREIAQAEARGERLVMDARTGEVRRDPGLPQAPARRTEVAWQKAPQQPQPRKTEVSWGKLTSSMNVFRSRTR